MKKQEQKQKLGPHQRKWLKALESGEYKQARAYLRTPKGYCCLGVACELAKVASRKTGTYWTFGDSAKSIAPEEVVEWLALRGDCGDAKFAFSEDLTALNDEARLTFPEIAKRVRANPENWFEEPR